MEVIVVLEVWCMECKRSTPSPTFVELPTAAQKATKKKLTLKNLTTVTDFAPASPPSPINTSPKDVLLG